MSERIVETVAAVRNLYVAITAAGLPLDGVAQADAVLTLMFAGDLTSEQETALATAITTAEGMAEPAIPPDPEVVAAAVAAREAAKARAAAQAQAVQLRRAYYQARGTEKLTAYINLKAA